MIPMNIKVTPAIAVGLFVDLLGLILLIAGITGLLDPAEFRNLTHTQARVAGCVMLALGVTVIWGSVYLFRLSERPLPKGDSAMETSEQETVFRPSKKKQAQILLLCIGGLVGTFIFLSDPKGVGGHFLFWGATIALGSSILGNLALLMFPNASFMRADGKGLTICSMWQSKFYPWNAIERFGAAQVNTGRNFVPVLAFKLSASAQAGPKTFAEGFNRALLPDGFDVTVDTDYGISFEDLAKQQDRV